MVDRNNGSKPKLCDEAAMSFAAARFVELHPRETCPEWLSRCTVMATRNDLARRFVVEFCVTPKSTNDAISYFEALVDPDTLEVTVLKDIDPNSFVGEELQGFDPSDLLPKTPGCKPG